MLSVVASPLVLIPASPPPSLSPSSPPTGLPCLSTAPNARSRSLAVPRSARLRTLNNPSPCVGDGDVAAERADLPSDGVRSFHAATMLRTDVSGERGDVCGRRSEDAVGVAVDVKPVNVFEYVPVPVPVPVTEPEAALLPEPVRV